MPSTHRPVVASVCAALACGAVLAPSSALAASDSTASSEARVRWLEMGELPDAPGNAHIGILTVREVGKDVGDVSGFVADLDCIAGATPRIPGDLPGEEEDEPCVVLAFRQVEGSGLAFTVDSRLSTATLAGDLTVGEDGAAAQTAPTHITWQGEGTATRTTEVGADGSRTTVKARNAVVAAGSRVGDMVFDDEPVESTSARLAAVRTLVR